MPTLSVLMPLYFRESPAYLDVSLASLAAQTRRADEVILVQEGTLTDEHHAVLDQWRAELGEGVLRVIDAGEAQGLPACLNVGLAHCTGEYVARFDTDDQCLPERFEHQLAYLQSHPKVALLGGHMAEFDPTFGRLVGYKRVPTHPAEIRRFARWRNPFNHPTVVYRRDVALALGGYPDMGANEDYAFWAKFLVAGHLTANLDLVLVNARAGEGLYRRRRGRRYLSGELETLRFLRQIRWLSPLEFGLSYGLRSTVRLLPVGFVERVYLFLRKA
ncbi:MAG: glycosyltransferase [Sphingobacteriaceae bacterium]|nr:glycosyltransferase [Cytophagaceae bacterium]